MLARYRASVVLSGVIVAVMVASVVAPGVHATLSSIAGVTAPRLRDGQLWRVPLSPLVQEDGGIRPEIVALLPGLWLAERWAGTRAALVGFFVVDALSTVPVLLTLDALAVHELAGEDPTDEPNLGSSAALLGLLTASLFGLPARERRVGLALVVLGLAITDALLADVAALQHTVAAAIGAAIGWRARRARNAR